MHGKKEPFGNHISVSNYIQNMEYIRRYRVKRQWQRWNPEDDSAHRLNRDDMQRFNAPTSLVNAMYSPTSNTITVYAGILQYPFVHPRFSDVTMYSTIGTVIGHEFSHALDPKGRLFDENGSFRYAARMGWWQRPTVTEYDRRVMQVIDEFGSHAHFKECPELEAQPTNLYGQHTITEDVADLVGVRAAYEAYFLNKTICHAAGNELMQEKHLFFYSFAQMWSSVATSKYECLVAQHDVHAAPRIRVDSTLRNLEYFQQLYVCPAGSEMLKTNDELINVF